MCSADVPDVFGTSSLRASHGDPLHDDIMPEVAEELGPGAEYMAASTAYTPVYTLYIRTHVHT